MTQYVDGFVIPIPTKNLTKYLRMAKLGAKVWMDHGALGYYECVGDDLETKCGIPFTQMAKAKRGETVVFSWIVFKSRAHRDKVNARVMQDPRITDGMLKELMPFDVKRMSYGGFKPIVHW